MSSPSESEAFVICIRSFEFGRGGVDFDVDSSSSVVFVGSDEIELLASSVFLIYAPSMTTTACCGCTNTYWPSSLNVVDGGGEGDAIDIVASDGFGGGCCKGGGLLGGAFTAGGCELLPSSDGDAGPLRNCPPLALAGVGAGVGCGLTGGKSSPTAIRAIDTSGRLVVRGVGCLKTASGLAADTRIN